MYHYTYNAILAEVITGLDNQSIMAAYKQKFKYIESKGYKMKINIMNNQARYFATPRYHASVPCGSHKPLLSGESYIMALLPVG